MYRLFITANTTSGHCVFRRESGRAEQAQPVVLAYLKSLPIIAALALMLTKPSTAQEMNYPLAVTATADGPIYIADRHLPGIWKIDGGELSLYYQGSKKFRTPLNAVRCVALDNEGQLLAGDTSTRQVYRFDENGEPQPLFTTKTGIGMPMALAVDKEGNVYIGDLELHWIWKLAPDSTEPVKYAEVTAPRGLALDAEGRLWCISGTTKDQLVRVETDGSVKVLLEGTAFEFPHHIVLDENNTAYITDGYAKSVWKVPLDGQPEKWVSGDPFVNPVGLGKQGENFLVADPRAKAIFTIDAEGTVTKIAPAE